MTDNSYTHRAFLGMFQVALGQPPPILSQLPFYNSDLEVKFVMHSKKYKFT